MNQDDRETLVQECTRIFTEHHPEYQVFSNKKIKFKGQGGEIDVLVISKHDIIIIECKAPLNPTSNFEMRASDDHVNKATKQLDHCKAALMDKSFRREFLRNLGVPDEPRNIHTCIVFGNRLFNGYFKNGHPIRYVRELDMILNNGHIYSAAGTWRVWKNDNFMHEDLIYFLSSNHPLRVANFNSMEKVEQFMFIKGEKMCFETYVFNLEKAVEQYNLLFPSIAREEIHSQ
ncbi:hypothetical protein D3C71_1382420 [compost metagenome]